MSGVGKGGGTPILAGWLWADLLLGLFVIFLAASAAPPREAVAVSATQSPQSSSATPKPTPTTRPTATPSRAVGPRPVEVTVTLDERKLLSADEAVVGSEQRRIADEIAGRLLAAAGQRQVAVALVFAPHQDPAQGDRLARIATAALRSGAFSEALVRPYRSLSSGSSGTLRLELYLYE